ncbi:hypothetical protein [Rahnella aceris]|uniref:hypothetical protein n=1 Tax=Rahnella sp. (strain Y9602) TaxID=2703885 RepID=UPI001C275712|nr:hypothetical protein [Rahnella aceris]MBU9853032.1 hypothetical protein [Rahnella aceris]
MELILSFISLFCLLAFILGLIKPQWVKMPNRKRSSAIYGLAFVFVGLLSASLFPTVQKDVAKTANSMEEKPPTFEYVDLKLVEYRRKPQAERHEIVNNYIKFKEIPASDSGGFYACMSQHSITKSAELPLGEVLGWCDADYQKDPKSLAAFINLDAFQSNFSGWNGAYRPLEKLIKKSMNDDSSYKHVETNSSLILGKDAHAVVKTTFKGTNAYGGVVTQQVAARVNLRTGDIENIIEQ